MIARPSGGFVGVDVFFVVSGFLITGLLLREFDRSGRISIGDFYRRRAKRILPAAALTLAVTAALSFLVFGAPRARETLIDAVAALFFVSNWRFAADGTDYFAADRAISPLQHFWTLSVEEQFYFLWPLVAIIATVWAVRRAAEPRTVLAVSAAVVSLLCLAWSFWETQNAPTAAYFSTISRAWELGVGALLAAIATSFDRIPRRARPVLFWIGLLGLLASFVVIDDRMPFPAPWALWPVVATAVVIASGAHLEHRWTFPLANAPMVWIGDLSYSLYLWHFPIIVFAAVITPDPGVLGTALIALAIVGASVLSFSLVEDPVRRSTWLTSARTAPRSRAWTVGWATAGALALFVPIASVAVDRTTGPSTATGTTGSIDQLLAEATVTTLWPALDPAIDELGPGPDMAKEAGCLNPTFPIPADTCISGSGEHLAVLVGDSFAVAWLPALRKALEPEDFRIKTIAFSTCPFADVTVTLELGRSASDRCNASREPLITAIDTLDPDLVIVVDSEYSATQNSGLGEDRVAGWAAARTTTLKQVVRPDRKVMIVQANPGAPSLDSCFSILGSPQGCMTSPDGAFQLKNDGDQQAALELDIAYVKTEQLFVADGRVMPFAGTTPQRWDSGHLTPDYADLIADDLDALIEKALTIGESAPAP